MSFEKILMYTRALGSYPNLPSNKKVQKFSNGSVIVDKQICDVDINSIVGTINTALSYGTWLDILTVDPLYANNYYKIERMIKQGLENDFEYFNQDQQLIHQNPTERIYLLKFEKSIFIDEGNHRITLAKILNDLNKTGIYKNNFEGKIKNVSLISIM